MKLLRGGCGYKAVAMIAVLSACGWAGVAQAYKFDTGPEWDVNLDNTVQYTMGWRAKDIDPRIGNHLFFDQGDYKFPDKGDMVTNRIQDLIEFQAIYKKDYGFRASASVWKDFAYNDEAKQNPAFVGIIPNAYPSGHYSDYTKRYVLEGGEWLDTFVFANTRIADKPVYIKAGRLSQYWGNAFFFGFSNIAYSQQPIDYIKGFSQPGSEVKELFLPRKQILLSTELSPELSVTAQYFFEHRPNRYPESATYLGFFNILFEGPPVAGALGIPTEGLEKVKGNNQNYGLKVTWSPKWAGGDMGFYYRQFDEVHPWLALINPVTGNMQNTFAKKAKLIGFSYERTFGLVSAGFELNQRRDTALASAALVPTNEGAKGTLTNVIANAFVQLGKTALWDTGILLAEVSYTHLNKVTSNAHLYNGEGTANCVNPITGGPGDWRHGCMTNNAVAVAALFTPQWLQVFPGVDLEMPISYTWGVHGNPAYAAGSFYAQGANIYSVGLKAIYHSKHSVSLQYNGYRWRTGDTADNGLGMGLPAYAGFGGNGAVSLNDRAWWQLQFKTSF